MKHLMIGLETMGNTSNSAIIAIGAVFFDLQTGEFGDEFYQEVNLGSCMQAGLVCDASTILWWMEQDEAARAKFFANDEASDIFTVIYNFNRFIDQNPCDDVQVWGNGIAFDIGILENAYNKCQIGTPWNFWSHRDVRTIVELDGGKGKRERAFEGVPHYAIDDAKHQVRYVRDTLKNIGFFHNREQNQ